MKGLQGKTPFSNMLTAEQKRIAKTLAEIEQEDVDRCARCGGEDCICCEYYHDRQNWKLPEELFDDDWSHEEEYYADKYEEDN